MQGRERTPWKGETTCSSHYSLQGKKTSWERHRILTEPWWPSSRLGDAAEDHAGMHRVGTAPRGDLGHPIPHQGPARGTRGRISGAEWPDLPFLSPKAPSWHGEGAQSQLWLHQRPRGLSSPHSSLFSPGPCPSWSTEPAGGNPRRVQSESQGRAPAAGMGLSGAGAGPAPLSLTPGRLSQPRQGAGSSLELTARMSCRITAAGGTLGALPGPPWLCLSPDLSPAAPLCLLLLSSTRAGSSALTIFRLVQRKAWHSRFSLSWFWAM